MRMRHSMSDRWATRRGAHRTRRPEAEALEGRILLYATIGQWTYSSRITYSFMPDGTSIAGTPSVLFQTMNAVTSTASWQNAIEQAATPWETNADLNLAQVSDDGAPVGTDGDQQDDPRFGDIRIGAMPLGSGVLAETFLPPPTNGGTVAGDIIFNSTAGWAVGGIGVDLETVALHEFGHAVGLGDQSSDPNSVMYYEYDGPKTALDSDDIAGIQSIYGAPQYDAFNTGLPHNTTPLTATNITPYISSNGQIALSGLDNTTPTDAEYYAVTVPLTNSGQMAVTLQSSNLSSFAPWLSVLNSSLSFVGQATAATTYGATLTVTVPVTAGQKYYIKASSAGSYGRVGSYGLEVNFGTQTMAPIAPPNTLVPQQPNGSGSGSTNNAVDGAVGHSGIPQGLPGLAWASVGGYSGWAETYVLPSSGSNPVAIAPPAPTPTTSPSPVIAGPVATPTPAPTSPTVVSPIAPLVEAAATPTPAPAPHRVVHQAVDATLSGWKGHRGRPRIGLKLRSAAVERDRLS